MIIPLDVFLEEQINSIKKELKTYSDYIDIMEKISNYNYPDRIWSLEFKEEMFRIWFDKQSDLYDRIISLYTKILINNYNNNKTDI